MPAVSGTWLITTSIARSDNEHRRAKTLLRLVRPSRSRDTPPAADSSTSTAPQPETAAMTKHLERSGPLGG